MDRLFLRGCVPLVARSLLNGVLGDRDVTDRRAGVEGVGDVDIGLEGRLEMEAWFTWPLAQDRKPGNFDSGAPLSETVSRCVE